MTNQPKNIIQALKIKPSVKKRSGQFTTQQPSSQAAKAACTHGNCHHGSCSGMTS